MWKYNLFNIFLFRHFIFFTLSLYFSLKDLDNILKRVFDFIFSFYKYYKLPFTCLGLHSTTWYFESEVSVKTASLFMAVIGSNLASGMSLLCWFLPYEAKGYVVSICVYMFCLLLENGLTNWRQTWHANALKPVRNCTKV